jgi:hypothetical protein
MYSTLQKNPNGDFFFLATYPYFGKLFGFRPKSGRQGTKRMVGTRKNEKKEL